MFATNTETGGRGEFLFLRPTADGDWDCVVDKAKKKRTGQTWEFPGNIVGRIVGSPAPDRKLVRFDPSPDESWFEDYGHIPLPPYMKRPDTASDTERYQTVYARETGSAAAPTAGLHFTPAILDRLEEREIRICWVTLEVGLGTFSPVRAENILDHPMHTEAYRVPEETAAEVNRAHKEGRKVLGVGTTSVRTLESAWDGALIPGEGETDLYIYPGYEFRAVDQIFTNFHTPRSSLLMMISAFCGRDRLLAAYETAIRKKYRFFSYEMRCSSAETEADQHSVGFVVHFLEFLTDAIQSGQMSFDDILIIEVAVFDPERFVFPVLDVVKIVPSESRFPGHQGIGLSQVPGFESELIKFLRVSHTVENGRFPGVVVEIRVEFIVLGCHCQIFVGDPEIHMHNKQIPVFLPILFIVDRGQGVQRVGEGRAECHGEVPDIFRTVLGIAVEVLMIEFVELFGILNLCSLQRRHSRNGCCQTEQCN